MRHIPIFGDPASLPPEVAGLPFAGVEEYSEPGLGVGIRYGDARTAKADAYLYDLGLHSVPEDVRAAEVVGWFQEACQGVLMAAERGLYLDLQTEASQFLHLPPEAPDPFCLWGAFSYRQDPKAGAGFSGRRFSNLALRTDCGYINKVRYTYPEAAGEAGLRAFIAFLLAWTVLIQEYGASEPERG